jgi:hypothetical protein
MPVQLIVGARDVLLRSRETRDRTISLVPGAEVVFLEQAGHVLPQQTQRVAEFLRRVTAPSAAVAYQKQPGLGFAHAPALG